MNDEGVYRVWRSRGRWLVGREGHLGMLGIHRHRDHALRHAQDLAAKSGSRVRVEDGYASDDASSPRSRPAV